MTMVELLTGMMVSVMLVGTAFSTFWVATNAWEKSKRRSDMLRMLNGTADLITRHLRAIQPPSYLGTPAFVAYEDGDELNDYDSIAFVSGANPRTPRPLELADLCEVQFYIDTGAAGTGGEAADGSAMPVLDAAYSDMTAEAAVPGSGAAPGSTLAPGEEETVRTGLWMRIDPTPDDDIESGGYEIPLGEQFTSLNFRYFDGTQWVDEWYDSTLVPDAVEFTLTVADAEGLENPMTMTRLVRIPTAKMINDDAANVYTDLTSGMESGDTSSGGGQPSGSGSYGSNSSSAGGGSGGGSGGGGSSSTGGGGSSGGR